MNCGQKVLVTGAGGFIGGHLVRDLVKRGCSNIRAVDVKPQSEWHQCLRQAENLTLNLRDAAACRRAAAGVDWIYNLASDMGGIGFIETYKTACMQSVLINTHLLLAARECAVKRFFFASSACVYNLAKQDRPDIPGLKEEDAYPAMPEDGYGWEKLFSERMCRHFREDYGLETRVARYHNVYGPHCSYEGGREKAPAAICRKVIEAKLTGHMTIEIWGNGEQTRSFMYIDDCLHGTHRIVESGISDPLNLGSDQMVTINELVDIAERIAGISLKRKYLLDAPRGVAGRNSDNTQIRKLLGWAPTIPLEEGLEETYRWVYDRMSRHR
jgi:GDP-D-mannose 3', 5'-epimerase